MTIIIFEFSYPFPSSDFRNTVFCANYHARLITWVTALVPRFLFTSHEITPPPSADLQGWKVCLLCVQDQIVSVTNQIVLVTDLGLTGLKALTNELTALGL